MPFLTAGIAALGAVGSVAGGLGSASTLISGAAGLAGLGMQIAGGSKATGAAQQAAQLNQANAGLEYQQEGLRNKAMQMTARRQQMEAIRNNQRARALALTNANSQGASLGSGLQGGYGQISGQTGVNLLGINQNLTLGNNMFAINGQISQNRQALYGVQSQMAEAQGQQALGGALMKGAGTIGALGGSAGGIFGSFNKFLNSGSNGGGEALTGFQENQ